MVMQLVDERVVDPDARVVTYLPDSRVRDEDVSGTGTFRHLRSHTSGIDGGLFDIARRRSRGAGDAA